MFIVCACFFHGLIRVFFFVRMFGLCLCFCICVFVCVNVHVFESKRMCTWVYSCGGSSIHLTI